MYFGYSFFYLFYIIVIKAITATVVVIVVVFLIIDVVLIVFPGPSVSPNLSLLSFYPLLCLMQSSSPANEVKHTSKRFSCESKQVTQHIQDFKQSGLVVVVVTREQMPMKYAHECKDNSLRKDRIMY